MVMSMLRDRHRWLRGREHTGGKCCRCCFRTRLSTQTSMVGLYSGRRNRWRTCWKIVDSDGDSISFFRDCHRGRSTCLNALKSSGRRLHAPVVSRRWLTRNIRRVDDWHHVGRSRQGDDGNNWD